MPVTGMAFSSDNLALMSVSADKSYEIVSCLPTKSGMSIVCAIFRSFPPDLSPGLFVVIAILIVILALIGGLYYFVFNGQTIDNHIDWNEVI